MTVTFDEWEPIYEAIRSDFGYDRTADERARDRLLERSSPFDDRRTDIDLGETVAVAGAGPALETEAAIERARAADAVVAASTAVDVLAENGISVDWMVTDLDKNPDTVVELATSSTPVAVHAHGDNIDAIDDVVPECPPGSILPTTQVRPRGHVVNVGGFTDGDRAAFLADSFGAAELVFVGWDFDDPSVGSVKARKLAWAERLLYWLERRRSDRFDVLDGRRETIDADALHIE